MPQDIIKSHCNTCGRETNHQVLHEEKQEGTEEYDENAHFDWWEHFRTLRCAGCETISLRIDKSHSAVSDDNGDPEVSTQHYPPSIFRPKPTWLAEPTMLLGCPFEIQDLLGEVYVCLQNDCPRAAAMSARALLEHVFVHTCGDRGSFKANVDAFEKAGHLSQTQRKLLDTVLDAGHATMHRGFEPSKHDLGTVVDMVESLVELLYVQKAKVEKLKKQIPPRTKT
jgi:hypothetical protein